MEDSVWHRLTSTLLLLGVFLADVGEHRASVKVASSRWAQGDFVGRKVSDVLM